MPLSISSCGVLMLPAERITASRACTSVDEDADADDDEARDDGVDGDAAIGAAAAPSHALTLTPAARVLVASHSMRSTSSCVASDKLSRVRAGKR